MVNEICLALTPKQCMDIVSKTLGDPLIIYPFIAIYFFSFLWVFSFALVKKTNGRKMISKKAFWAIWIPAFFLPLALTLLIPVISYILQKILGGG